MQSANLHGAFRQSGQRSSVVVSRSVRKIYGRLAQGWHGRASAALVSTYGPRRTLCYDWQRIGWMYGKAGARRWIETASDSMTPQEREEWMESKIRSCPVNNSVTVLNQLEGSGNILRSAAWASLLSLSDEVGSIGGDDVESKFVDWRTYHSVLKGWSTSGSNGSPQRAEFWILRQERYHTSLQSLLETVQGATLEDADARETQQAVLPVLESISQRVAPNVHSYNAVLESWATARSVPPTAVVRAERWLTKMVQSHDLVPNTESYNFFLDVCTKGWARKDRHLQSNALLAQNTLEQMGQHAPPNTESYNFVLRGWTRCRHDINVASRVMSILRQMESLHRSHVLQTATNWNDNTPSPVRPNTKSYNHAVYAWALTAELRARRDLQRRRLDDRRNRGGGTHQRVEKDAHCSAEELREEEQWGDSVQDALDSAEAIVQYMHDIHNAGVEDIFPNTVVYNTLIRAYAGIADYQDWVDAPLKAEQVLRRMIDASEEAGGRLDMAPDSRSYLHIMKAWAKTKRPNGAARIEWWLHRLSGAHANADERDAARQQEENAKLPAPTIEMYNLLMEAYAGLHDSRKVDDIGSKLFELEESSAGDLDGTQKEVALLSLTTDSFSVIIRSWLQYEARLAEGFGEADAMDGEGCLMAFSWLEELIYREEEEVEEELSEKGAKTPVASVKVTPDLFTSFLRMASQSRACDLLHVTSFVFEKYRKSRFRFESEAYVWLLQVGMRQLSNSATAPSSFLTWSLREETLLKKRVNRTIFDDGQHEPYRDTAHFVQQLLKRCCDDGHLTSLMVRAVVDGHIRGAELNSQELSEIRNEYFASWPLPRNWSRNVRDREQVPTREDARVKQTGSKEQSRFSGLYT